MIIGWPQAIYLALLFIGLGIELARDGEPKKPGKHQFVPVLIVNALIFGLLYLGGFFG